MIVLSQRRDCLAPSLIANEISHQTLVTSIRSTMMFLSLTQGFAHFIVILMKDNVGKMHQFMCMHDLYMLLYMRMMIATDGIF